MRYLPTADCRLPTADCRLPTADCRRGTRSFTLIELLSAILILGALIATATIFIVGYIRDAQTTSDRQVLAVLNDAVNRYKGMGGNVNALTAGAPIGNIISRLSQPVSWCGVTHQFLNKGYTFPARSLFAQGNGAQYIFSRCNTYTDSSYDASAPNATYPYGLGTGYMANNSAQAYNVTINTSTGYFAYLSEGASTPTILAQGARTIPICNSFTFWSCTNGNSTKSGNITLVVADSNYLAALNVSGLANLTSLQAMYAYITSIDLRPNTLLQSVNISYSPTLTTVNASGLAFLASAGFHHNNSIASVNLQGCSALNAGGITIAWNSFHSLSSINCAGTLAVANATNLANLYSGNATGGSSNDVSVGAILYVGSAAASLGVATTAATAKGWTVSYTP